MIGVTDYGQPLVVPLPSRRRHLYVIGQTGTGKSSLLNHLITQDLAVGRGLALIDPHGDLAQSILAMIPPHRAHQLVYLNPADLDRPMGFNLLAAMGKAEFRDLGLDGGTLYDPEVNYRKVRGSVWDWNDNPDPKPLATRTVDTKAQDGSVKGQ